MTWSIGVGLVALACGCGTPCRTVVLSVGDPSLVATVQAAADEWVATCGADVRLDASGIPVAVSDDGVMPGSGGATRMHDGRAMWIYVRPGSQERDVALYTHEIGHALGLWHTDPGVVDVMAATLTTERHVTQADCSRLP